VQVRELLELLDCVLSLPGGGAGGAGAPMPTNVSAASPNCCLIVSRPVSSAIVGYAHLLVSCGSYQTG
jgi:hypothetical protein